MRTLKLIQTNQKLARLDFERQLPILANLVRWFIDEELVKANAVTAKILNHIDLVRTVTDMARLTNLSPRQLQRTLNRTSGLSPHDLLKVLRVQRSFKQHYLDLYADQSHYIHSFRQVTDYTPAKYTAKFDVRSIQYSGTMCRLK